LILFLVNVKLSCRLINLHCSLTVKEIVMYLTKLLSDALGTSKSKFEKDDEKLNKKSYSSFRRLVKKHNLSYEIDNSLGYVSYIKVDPSPSIPQFPNGLSWVHDSWWCKAESNIDAAITNKFSPEDIEWINSEGGFINE